MNLTTRHTVYMSGALTGRDAGLRRPRPRIADGMEQMRMIDSPRSGCAALRGADSAARYPYQGLLFCLVSIILLVASGCGKKDGASETPEIVAPSTQQVAVAVPAQPGANRPQQQPNATAAPQAAEPDLSTLSREVRRWIIRNKKRPTTFEEVFASSNVQVPPPPPGKKYGITREMKVVLVDR